MIRVYFYNSTNIPIWRQLPNGKDTIVNNCQYVFNDEEDYDYWVSITVPKKTILSKVPKERCLFFYGESPNVMKYQENGLTQFGHTYGFDKEYLNKGILNSLFSQFIWMIGIRSEEGMQNWQNDVMTYNDFRQLRPNQKINKACLITSNKSWTKGHRRRLEFVERILKDKLDFIDIYGEGYCHVGDKLDVYQKYKYAIVIENDSYNDYWTEKIQDCYLAGTYPFYYGCPNIGDYFDETSFTKLDIANYNESIKTIKDLINSGIYEKSKDALLMSKDKVLNEYNLFNQISEIVSNIDKAMSPKTANNAMYRIEPFAKHRSYFERIFSRLNVMLWRLKLNIKLNYMP